MGRLLFFMLGMLLISAQVLAQNNRTISGRVTDAKGDPVANASISVKGTKIGTIANNDGRFSISVPSNATTLVVSSTSFETIEVPVDNASSITLTQANRAMNEVVVTALGIARDKRSLGYATQNLNNEQIANKGTPNLVDALQGKLAGVNITSSSASPGASVNINIRGIASFTGNNQPLFVIDGVPISNDVDRTNGGTLGTLGDNQPANRALDIDPNNVESINVLKGPAAAVLYGSRAANGAIIITTKKGAGAKGKTSIVLNSAYSFQHMYGYLKFQNLYGQGTLGVFNPTSANSWGPKFGSTPTVANGLILSSAATVNGVSYAAGQTVAYQAYPDNIENFFQRGSLGDNSLSINSGDANQNWSFSFGNVNQKGIVPNTSLKRTNVRAGFNTIFNQKWHLGTNVAFTQTLQNGVLQGNGSSVVGSLFGVPRSMDLQYYKRNNNWKLPDGSNNWYVSGTDNPYFDAYENPLKSNLYRILGSFTLGYDFSSWLTASYRLGIDAYTDRRKQIFAITSAVRPSGQVLEDEFYRSELNGDLMITAHKNNFFLNGLDARLLLGNNVNQRKFQNVSARGDALVFPGFYNLSNATVFTSTGEANTVRRLYGFYGQLSLAYNNYLFVELTGRNDVSSTLPKSNNSFFYPSANIGFVFTDALKLQNSILSYGKLRASIARVGNDAAPYLLQQLYVNGGYGNNVASVSFPLSVNGTSVPGFGASTTIPPAQPLKPEFRTSKEIGLNLAFWRNKISIDAAYFTDVSSKQIISVAIPVSTGYSAYTTNIGKMTNKGIELLVNGSPFSGKNFAWDVSFNFTRIRNMVNEIAPGVTSFNIPGNRFTGTIPTIMVGKPYGVVIGTANPKDSAGNFIINPATGTYAAGVANQILADPNPNYTMGLNNNLHYKNFSLGFLFDYTDGGQFVSFSAGFAKSRGTLYETGIDRESPRIIPGVIVDPTTGKETPNNIQISAQTYWQAEGLQSELNVYDATVLRLRELTFGYDLPKNLTGKMHISGIYFGVFARNVWFYAPNSPIDPEVNTQGAGNIRGLELQNFPNARSMGINLKLSL